MKFFNIAIIGMIALATPALAQTAQTTSVNPPPPPAPSFNTTFSVGGQATFGGFGGSTFTGQSGFNHVEKTGSGGIDVTAAGGGNTCQFNCNNGSYTFKGFANERVMVATGAHGTQSGTAVTAVNEGGAQAKVTFNYNVAKPIAPVSPPTPAH